MENMPRVKIPESQQVSRPATGKDYRGGQIQIGGRGIELDEQVILRKEGYDGVLAVVTDKEEGSYVFRYQVAVVTPFSHTQPQEFWVKPSELEPLENP